MGGEKYSRSRWITADVSLDTRSDGRQPLSWSSTRVAERRSLDRGGQWASAISGAIVKICGSRSLGGLLSGSFDQDAVEECRSSSDQRDEVGCVDRPPACLG
jgi:hypothetical protein